MRICQGRLGTEVWYPIGQWPPRPFAQAARRQPTAQRKEEACVPGQGQREPGRVAEAESDSPLLIRRRARASHLTSSHLAIQSPNRLFAFPRLGDQRAPQPTRPPPISSGRRRRRYVRVDPPPSSLAPLHRLRPATSSFVIIAIEHRSPLFGCS